MFVRHLAAAALLALAAPAVAQTTSPDVTVGTPPVGSAPIEGKFLWRMSGVNMDIPLSLTRYSAANTTTAARSEALRVYRQILEDRHLAKAEVDAAVAAASAELKMRALAGEEYAGYKIEFNADTYVLIIVNKVAL